MRSSLLLLASLLSVPAVAGTLSELDVFNRCYVRMVRSVPVTTDALYKAVAAKQKTGAQACLELFDRAALDANGLLKNRNSAEARKILKTFNDLHRGWFQSKVIDANTALITDAEEPALFYTRAAFQPNVQFKTIVTSTSGLRGVRTPARQDFSKFKTQRVAAYSTAKEVDTNRPYPYVNDTRLLIASLNYQKNAAGTYVFTKYDTNVVPDAKITDIGQLIGITASAPLALSNFYGGYSQGSVDFKKATELTYSANNFLMNAHMGGGILGSQAFLMANINLGVNQIPDKVERINRRLSGRIFEDLMCHQMPTLLDADVASETNSLIAQNTPHTFQRSTSCMRCHSGIDGLGYGLRNLMLIQSSGNPNFGTQEAGVRVVGVLRLPAVAGATTFALQAPTGRLHYREVMTNKRIDLSMGSLTDLGNKIALNNDIYYCAAKRYYYFLTGINVDITQAPANALDSSHYQKVKLLGDNFKKSQSVRSLLNEIITSPAFRTWNYKSTEEQ